MCRLEVPGKTELGAERIGGPLAGLNPLQGLVAEANHSTQRNDLTRAY